MILKSKKFRQHKCPALIKNLDISNIVVSKKVSIGKTGFTFFIGYKDSKKIKPLCLFSPKMRAYKRGFNETNYVSFLAKNDESLEKRNEIWEKVKNSIKKEFYSEPLYH